MKRQFINTTEDLLIVAGTRYLGFIRNLPSLLMLLTAAWIINDTWLLCDSRDQPERALC